MIPTSVTPAIFKPGSTVLKTKEKQTWIPDKKFPGMTDEGSDPDKTSASSPPNASIRVHSIEKHGCLIKISRMTDERVDSRLLISGMAKLLM